MTYILYFVVSLLLMWFCAKNNLEPPNETALVIIAILTAGEVISWRCSK